MKKLFYFINALLASAFFVGNYFYTTSGGLLIKSLCSGGFALMGILNLIYTLRSRKPWKFSAIMSVGLVLAMLGDLTLGFRFALGAGLFAAGHICYWAAQCAILKFSRRDLLTGLLIFAAAGAFLMWSPILHFGNESNRWICMAYALIISMMTGKAVANFVRRPCGLTLLMGIACVLFFISDLMLVFDWFTSISGWTGNLCMATYYPAECLLAFAPLYAVAARKN